MVRLHNSMIDIACSQSIDHWKDLILLHYHAGRDFTRVSNVAQDALLCGQGSFHAILGKLPEAGGKAKFARINQWSHS